MLSRYAPSPSQMWMASLLVLEGRRLKLVGQGSASRNTGWILFMLSTFHSSWECFPRNMIILAIKKLHLKTENVWMISSLDIFHCVCIPYIHRYISISVYLWYICIYKFSTWVYITAMRWLYVFFKNLRFCCCSFETQPFYVAPTLPELAM